MLKVDAKQLHLITSLLKRLPDEYDKEGNGIYNNITEKEIEKLKLFKYNVIIVVRNK